MRYTIITLLCASLFLVPGCKSSTQHTLKLDPYVDVNVDFVKSNCVPEEHYQFPVFDVYAMPARLKNCAGVDDLWVVAWPGEDTELERGVANVLTILYVRSINENKSLPETPDIKTSFIKNSSSSDNNFHAVFYKILEVPAPKPPEE